MVCHVPEAATKIISLVKYQHKKKHQPNVIQLFFIKSYLSEQLIFRLFCFLLYLLRFRCHYAQPNDKLTV